MAGVDVTKSCKKIIKYEYDYDIMSMEWWQKNVMYHVYLPSFKDSNNDGIGDFQGDYSENVHIYLIYRIQFLFLSYNLPIVIFRFNIKFGLF